MARRLLCSCGEGAPECTGSVVGVRALSCPTARGLLVPRPGIEPKSPALEGRFLITGPTGKSPRYTLKHHIPQDFPGGAVVKNLPANAGDTGSSPGRKDPTCRGATKPSSHNY